MSSLGVTPDIMTLAKALGNGLPIGAMLTTEAIAASLVRRHPCLHLWWQSSGCGCCG